jgi:hypothetical protein
VDGIADSSRSILSSINETIASFGNASRKEKDEGVIHALAIRYL